MTRGHLRVLACAALLLLLCVAAEAKKHKKIRVAPMRFVEQNPGNSSQNQGNDEKNQGNDANAGWGKCSASCGEGTQTRTNGGVEETRSCVDLPVCPTEPVVTASTISAPATGTDGWDKFSECSVSCGKGTQTRTCKHPDKGCSGDSSQDCNTQDCPVLRCIANSWIAENDCDRPCGNGTQSFLMTYSDSSNDSCPKVREIKSCNDFPCPAHCIQTAWAFADDACSHSCDGGVRVMTRSVTQQPAHGGRECGPSTQEIPCNTAPCMVDSTMGDWAPCPGSNCSAECGDGTQDWCRSGPSGVVTGRPVGPLKETRTCNVRPCAKTCIMNDWEAAEACNATCGTGSQRFRRTVNRTNDQYAAECGPQEEVRACNTHLCNTDCQFGAWVLADGVDCNATCGGGYRRYTRSPTGQASTGGKPCARTQILEACNTFPCPIDAIQSDWAPRANCSVTCDSGTQPWGRSCQPGNQWGRICGETTQSRVCHLAPCPGTH